MFPALKKALTPTSMLGQSQGSEVESYGDSYFREIGFKIGENSFVGSTESPDQDGQEAMDHVDLDLPQDSGLENYNVTHTVNSIRNSNHKRSRVKSKKPHRLTMADAYGTPTHLFSHHRAFPNDPRSADSSRGLRYGDIDEYAITLRKKASDDVTISTLGEESIKRKPSPLYAQQLYKATHQKSFVKPPIRHQIDALDLKKTSTGSTLEERPSEDSRDRPPKSSSHPRRSTSEVPDGNEGVPKKRWGLIYFVFGSALILLAAASVVIGICMMQWMSQGQSNQSGTETVTTTTSTWAPRVPEDWGNVSKGESASDPAEMARQDLLRIISDVSPSSLASVSNASSPQYRAFEWAVHDPNYFGYSIDRIVQRWSMAVIFESLGIGSWLTVDAHECLWYSTDAEDVCDDNGNMVVLHMSNSGLYGSIPPEVSLLGPTLERMHLPSNNITGTIPTEIGALTNLVRLDLDSNVIEGTIPSELARLVNLVIFSLGQNHITGTIPSELGNLGKLASLVLEENKLQGSVPSQLGRLVSLEILNLKSNHLNGTLPTELGKLQTLNFLSLYQNEFSGNMPDQVCLNYEFDSQLVIAADCSEVNCSCCTLCCYDCKGGRAGTLVTLPSSATNETNVPPMFPTKSPSCATLSIKKSCFVQNKTSLQVQFQNCEASEDDWIGLFQDGFLNSNPLAALTLVKDKAELWTRPCGDQECTKPIPEGSVSLGPVNVEEGQYIVVLMREGVQLATTNRFEVIPVCN